MLEKKANTYSDHWLKRKIKEDKQCEKANGRAFERMEGVEMSPAVGACVLPSTKDKQSTEGTRLER